MGKSSKSHDVRDAALRAAVADAVKRSRKFAKSQLATLSQRGDAWQSYLSDLNLADLPGSEAGEQRDQLNELVSKDIADALASLRTRVQHLDQINVVMFGRTGAGKSSLVEAITRGDGSRVSPDGRLDFTREISELDWNGIRLIDTPGIEGWAAADDRAAIEEAAHSAVERADLVILMFDDYNQKLGEFQQVGRWVTELGKAAIAVLNIRDDGWRYDERLFHEDDREASAQSVREHHSHTTKMLAEFGLGGIPTTVMNLAWGFAARGSDLSGHPAALDLQAARTVTGVERLESISNLPPLIQLITKLLTEEPEALRLGALHQEEQACLASVGSQLSETSEVLEVLSAQQKTAINSCLAITGVPSRAVAKTDVNRDDKRLADFRENLARAGFDVSGSDGESTRILGSHLNLDGCRKAGLRAAQDILSVKRAKRKMATGKELQAVALKAARFEEVANQALASAIDEIKSQLEAMEHDLALDFGLELEDLLDDLKYGYDPGEGAEKRWIGGVGGFGVAAIGGVLLLTNPIGWATVGIVGGIALGGLIFRKIRQSGNKDREKAALKAEKEIQVWLKECSKQCKESAQEQIRITAGLIALTTHGPVVDRYLATNQLVTTIDAIRSDVDAFARSRPERQSPISLLQTAVTAVEADRFPGSSDAGSLVWLGEDWLGSEWQGCADDSTPFERPTIGRAVKLRKIRKQSAERFWRRADELANAHRTLADAVMAGHTVLANPPLIALAGDFSSGKTSLIRRLALELGIPVEDRLNELRIGGEPTTSAVIELPGGAITLCDTPGLGSENPDHDVLAQSAVAGAAMILACHTPVSGKLDGTAQLVTPPNGFISRGNRVIHVLSRIDALSARPHTDPEGFMRLLGAKRHEVAERLEMRGMPIHGDCPLPVAADPGGRRAHKPTWVLDDFSNSKGWDGIADLIDVIKRLAAAGLDHAAIDRTVSELVKAKAELESKAGLEDRSVRECDRLISIYTVAGKRFERLLDSARTRLASIIDEEIAKRLGDLSDFPTAKLEEIKASPEKWIITADLSDALDEWRKWVATSVASINDELGREIEARIESRAFAEAKKSGALDGLAADLIKGLVGLAGEAAGRAGQEAAEQAAANAVRLIANQIPELAPYAGQLGARLAQGVGAAAGVLVEGVLQTYDEVKQREREKDLADLATTLHSAGAEWVTGVIEGIGDTPGILDAVVKETTELINGGLEELTDRRDRVAAYSGSLVSSAAAADDLIHLGRECSIAS